MTDWFARFRVVATYALVAGSIGGGAIAFASGHDGAGYGFGGALVALFVAELFRWAEARAAR